MARKTIKYSWNSGKKELNTWGYNADTTSQEMTEDWLLAHM
jgi:hypothetical protein